MKQFPYCFASFGLMIRQRSDTIRSRPPRTILCALTHKLRPVTILWIKKTFRNFRFYSDFFLCPITSSIDFGSVLSLPQQENAERKIKFMIIWNQDEIVISCFMNLSWQFRILILNEKLFSINSFAAWIFWCWKITRIRKKKPLEFCVWVCVSVCGSGAKICRKLLISYKKKIVLKNNRFLKIFVLLHGRFAVITEKRKGPSSLNALIFVEMKCLFNKRVDWFSFKWQT